MIHAIETSTRLEAWVEATDYLVSAGTTLNLILSISSPGSDGPSAGQATDLADNFLISEDAHPTHAVAETIFPGWEYSRRGLQGVYDTYADEEYPLVRAQWGTYAQRLLLRRGANGEVVRPLQTLIEKMQREANHAHGSKKACYELGVAEGEYDMPLYNPASDRRLVRGGPCLSHLSFKLYEDRAHLTALYRSHDYRYKALGNLLGLARLQACVANEVGVGIGGLVVHSTYAWLDRGRGKTPLRSLLAALRQLGAGSD